MAPSAPHPLLPPLTGSSKAFFINSPNEDAPVYHDHPTIKNTIRVTLESAGVGLLVSSVQNALEKHNKGAMGVFTRTGGTIAQFAAMGFAFSFTQNYVANLRQTDDALNGAAGGCAAGFVAGVRAKSLPLAFGACAGMATLIGTFQAAGNQLVGEDRLKTDRPDREERRLRFFKQPKVAEEVA